MSDFTEELSRLAELRDRGVLTQEEFDHQKALLLNPPASPPHVDAPPPAPNTTYAAPSGGPNNTVLYIVGGLVLLVAVAGALWATGVLKPLGLNPPGEITGNSAMAFTPPGMANSSTVAPAAAPTIPAMVAPTSAPTYESSATDAANPLLGSWEGNSSNKGSCPLRLNFAPTYLMMAVANPNVPTTSTKDVNVTYTVQSATSVVVTPQTDGGQPGTAVITGNQMVLDDCGFTRSTN